MENNNCPEKILPTVNHSRMKTVRLEMESSITSFDQLLKPSIMMIEDLKEIDSSYVISSKLDGERALLTIKFATMTLDYGYKKEIRKVNPDTDMVLDVEVVNGEIYCLDVLWMSDRSVIHNFLASRLKYMKADVAADYGIKLQKYFLFGSFEATQLMEGTNEGIIVQHARSPYIKQYTRLYKVKIQETVDLLVDGQDLVVVEPSHQVIMKNEYQLETGTIVEMGCMTKDFIKIRDDKLKPNSGPIVARAMSSTRVPFGVFYRYHNKHKLVPHRDLDDIESSNPFETAVLIRGNEPVLNLYEKWKDKEDVVDKKKKKPKGKPKGKPEGKPKAKYKEKKI
jgi:hypothetical protein